MGWVVDCGQEARPPLLIYAAQARQWLRHVADHMPKYAHAVQLASNTKAFSRYAGSEAMTKMKSIYLNGKLVGEAAATGDLEADQLAALQVLKDTGNYREPSLVDGMFRQALSFATTSAYLYERDLLKVPRNGLSVAPFVVNSTLAIELYLKTLGQLYSVKSRGHDLLTLFDKLPPEAVDSLRANFEKSSRRCEIRTIADYREALAALRLAFVEWRYVYEKERSSTITFEPMIFVMQVLHEACRARMKTGTAHP